MNLRQVSCGVSVLASLKRCERSQRGDLVTKRVLDHCDELVALVALLELRDHRARLREATFQDQQSRQLEVAVRLRRRIELRLLQELRTCLWVPAHSCEVTGKVAATDR